MKGISLGILGLGSQTTAFYLKELNRVFNEKEGGYSTCPFILCNTNFNAINSLLPNVSKELDGIVQAYISDIEKTAIKHLLIPNITLHETIDRLKINISILHPFELCVSKMNEKNWKQAFLFGSMYTMQSKYLQTNFAKNDIEILLPSEEDCLFIDQFRSAVYKETQTEELINLYHLIIDKYTVKHPVIMACTELSIFKLKHKKLLDMAQLQIEEAVKTVLLNTKNNL